MDVFVKICGIASLSDLVEVAALKPDALGFVLWDGSPRNVQPDDLVNWLRLVPTAAVKVGVFVNPDPKTAMDIARRAGLDAIQLHQVESLAPYDIAGVRVWRAVYAERMRKPAVERGRVDAYVADTYSKSAPGGTGMVGNWEAVRHLVQTTATPVLLAGGLNPRNVREALHAVNPWGVDVSSGVEERPGRKDINRVREFIQQCRTA